MPRYRYKCTLCGSIEEVFHLMSESKTDCDGCNAEDVLERIPSLFSVTEESKTHSTTAKERVDSFISDAKSELKSHQEDGRKDYEP